MFSSEHIDSSPSPSFAKRLASERKVNVYFLPGQDPQGRKNYAYAVVSSALHEKFMEDIESGNIPDYAVIVEMGFGDPSDDVKAKLKKYYGFEHAADNDNANPQDNAASA